MRKNNPASPFEYSKQERKIYQEIQKKLEEL